MKQFNDSVLYVRNGTVIPAIVLKSAISHPRPDLPAGVQHSKLHKDEAPVETLTLLYADPDNGVGLVNSGTTAKIPLIAFAVKPWTDGSAFGWKERDDDAYLSKLADEAIAMRKDDDEKTSELAKLTSEQEESEPKTAESE